MSKKEVEKKSVPRGFSEQIYNDDINLCVWKDNKAVYCASNYVTGDLTDRCKRYDRSAKKSVHVLVPDQVRHYNTTMGGVDQLDQMVALYRSPVRIKKWWFSFYTWSLHVLAVNAWRLKSKHRGEKEPYLGFLCELVTGLLAENGTPPSQTRLPLSVSDCLRYDGSNHWPAYTDEEKKRRNCKQCTLDGKRNNKTNLICTKCMVPLHVPECFQAGCFFFKITPKLFNIFLIIFKVYSDYLPPDWC